MARIPEPASDRQMNYLEALQRKLADLLDEGNEITEQLGQAVASSLSKRDASKLIDTLIKAINRLGGEEDATVVPIRQESAGDRALRKDKEDREKRRAAVSAQIDAYNREQALQFGVPERRLSEDRPAPEGSHYLKVWKRRPNSGYSENYGWGFGKFAISYGWAWSCSHPSHKGKGGPGSKLGVVYGGSVTKGYEGTIEGAQRHWQKYHANE